MTSARTLLDERGLALAMVLVIAALLLALGSGLIMLVSSESVAAGRHLAALRTAYLAEAALLRATGELASAGDWNAVVAGTLTSPWHGGSEVLSLPGRDIDLGALGPALPPHATGCDAGEPRWRLFGFGPVGAMVSGDVTGLAGGAAVWVADDCADEDDDPGRDANGVVMVRSMAADSWQSRKWFQATIARREGKVETLAWREIATE